MMEKLETHWKPAMMAFCQNDQIYGISNVIDVGLEIQLIFFVRNLSWRGFGRFLVGFRQVSGCYIIDGPQGTLQLLIIYWYQWLHKMKLP